jgi:hypothetical protein
MFPGTLAVDQIGQLMQATGDVEFSNANPMVNTVLITACVQVGMRLKDVSLGIAMYTFIQLTLYALAATYALTVLDKVGVPVIAQFFCNVFFIFPINAIYATGMWKDTFFAIIFLANMAYMTDVFAENEPPAKRRLLMLALLAALTSLARNSGWSSLLVCDICILAYAGTKNMRANPVRKRMYRAVAACEILGIAAALIFSFGVLRLFGIQSLDAHTGTAVVVQQLSRVVADGAYTDEEAEMILNLSASDNILEGIKADYEPSLVDHVRSYYDSEKLQSSQFWSTWLKIGLNHPYEYFVAVVDHTVNYWWPLSSSWLVDFRIFDNPYGVTRVPKLFKSMNLARVIYQSLFKLVPLIAFSNSGFTLWMILLCMYICAKQKNHAGCLLAVPSLMIYAGLMLTSYGSLFRYTYAAVLAMPLLIAYCCLKTGDSGKEETVKPDN